MLALLLNLGFAASNAIPSTSIPAEYQHGTHAVAVHSQNRSFVTPSARTQNAPLQAILTAGQSQDAPYGQVFAAAVATASSAAVPSFSTGPPQTDSAYGSVFASLMAGGIPSVPLRTTVASLPVVDTAYGAIFPATSTVIAQNYAVKVAIAAPQTDTTLQPWIIRSAATGVGFAARTILAAPQVDLTLSAQVTGSASTGVGFAARTVIASPQWVDSSGQVFPAATASVVVQSYAVRFISNAPTYRDVDSFVTPPAAPLGLTGQLFSFATGSVQVGGQGAGAGKHRKRYCIRDGWRLLCYESKADADAARNVVKRRFVKVLPKPVPTVIEIKPLRALASSQHVLPELNDLLARKKYEAAVELGKRLALTREEEETAVALLLGMNPTATREEEEIAVVLLLL